MIAFLPRALASLAAVGVLSWAAASLAQSGPAKPAAKSPPATKARAAKAPAANQPLAKPPTTPPAAASPAAAPAPDTAAGKFAQTFEQWKGLLKDLRKLKAQYSTSSSDDQEQYRKQWTDLVATGNTLLPKLADDASKAYAEAPNASPEITQLLMKLATDAIARDDYEQAGPIAQTLIDNGCEDKQAYDVAGTVAFVNNDYDKADEYFKAGKEAGALSKDGSELYASLDSQKELWAKEKEIREAEAKADDLPRVKLKTTKGDIVLELFENEAPETVGNFISLVESDFYKGVPFHRVLENFMAQGGDPTGQGTGGPGYNIYCECYKPEYRRHFRGSLSMAHAGKNTGGSQFFLTFRQTPMLNGKHTAFGRVVEGMDVLAKIQRRNPDKPPLPEPDRIVSAEVVRKRDHAYVPHKVE